MSGQAMSAWLITEDVVPTRSGIIVVNNLLTKSMGHHDISHDLKKIKGRPSLNNGRARNNKKNERFRLRKVKKNI